MAATEALGALRRFCRCLGVKFGVGESAGEWRSEQTNPERRDGNPEWSPSTQGGGQEQAGGAELLIQSKQYQ